MYETPSQAPQLMDQRADYTLKWDAGVWTSETYILEFDMNSGMDGTLVKRQHIPYTLHGTRCWIIGA